MLLHILTSCVNEGFVQHISICLLNTVVDQLNDKQRNEIGDAGAIEVKKLRILISSKL